MPTIAPDVLDELVHAGTTSWEAFRKSLGGAFHTFLPADYRGAHDQLARLRPRADSFVELGSGVGVHTIIASLLGYDAYGIEIEADLVEEAERLGARFGARPTFVEGSFVSPEYREDVELLPSDFLTEADGADAWDELGMTLADFDVVYVYPWPGEEDWLEEMVRRFATPGTLLLMYASGEGYLVREV